MRIVVIYIFPFLFISIYCTNLRLGRSKGGNLGAPAGHYNVEELPKPQWFEQKLDHSSRTDLRTWKQLVEGYVQFRMELGSGEVAVRAGDAAADGRWHDVRLERRGASVRLAVDRRAAAAAAPPPAAALDVRAARRLLVGAAPPPSSAPLAAHRPFRGCLADLRLAGRALPLHAGAASADGRVLLVRADGVRLAAECPPQPPPTPCSALPCLNGGECRDLPLGAGAYECECPARFGGARCELDAEPCASAPCLHGGTCAPAGGGGYTCACAAGLAGARCERGRWCRAGVCAHGGACEEGDAGPSCSCRGYFGALCQHDVDECAGEPCLNGATCVNEPGSFRCLCPPDKTGMNCGNPLYSDAVTAGGGALAALWRWAAAERWPLAAAAAALLALAALLLLPLWLRRRARPAPPAATLNKLAPRPKLSNLEAVRRERPASCADPPPLNNVDTLRSYGSAGDELEGIPPDYRRNLNINIDAGDRKPWSEQMHLHTFVDNKIYNDLKGLGRRAAGEPHLVGGYHWDCSDWCGGGGALPGISEVAGSERPDSSDPSPPASLRAPSPAPSLGPSLGPSLAPALSAPDDSAGEDARRAALRVREPDAASLITMLEERTSLLAASEGGSCGDLSARLCEIEDSDEECPALLPGPRHTDV